MENIISWRVKSANGKKVSALNQAAERLAGSGVSFVIVRHIVPFSLFLYEQRCRTHAILSIRLSVQFIPHRICI